MSVFVPLLFKRYQMILNYRRIDFSFNFLKYSYRLIRLKIIIHIMNKFNPAITVENNLDKEELPFVEYITCNIPGEDSDREAFEIQYAGCSCKEKCQERDCPCLLRYGNNYDNSGKLLSININNFSRPILECNKSCSCSVNCSNRQVQKGIKYSLCIFKTEHKGWGLKTKEFIPCNHFVCEYAGEVIGKKEAKKRLEKLTHLESNYLLVVREHVAGNKLIETFIDPKYKGNVGRYINHSCDPNLIMIPVRINNSVPKICLYSQKDIYPDEELTYHYSGVENSNFGCQETNDECSKTLKQCLCVSSRCTGFLPFCNGLIL